jgi:hypothetical protein
VGNGFNRQGYLRFSGLTAIPHDTSGMAMAQ